VLGAVLGVLWLFVRGVELTPDALLGEFALGAAVGMPVAYLSRRLYTETIDLGQLGTALPYAALYISTFLREVIVANVDVAYRVLAPSMPIDPEVILVPLRVETDVGVTTIANSITITPGTLTLDYDPERNALYVHVIDGGEIDDVIDPIRTWEDYALRCFDEKRSPDDVAPEIAVYPADEPTPPTVETDRSREEERRDEAIDDPDGRERRSADADRDAPNGGERDGQ
jgi:multicomponent Na+:H+ antiporter subunit E